MNEPVSPPNRPVGHGHGMGAHLLRPTAWPMVMAVGIALFLAGIALSVYFSLGGAIVFAIALSGWIGELRRA